MSEVPLLVQDVGTTHTVDYEGFGTPGFRG